MGGGARTVYSSRHGRMCPGCGRPRDRCACRSPRAPRGDGIVRVGREVRRGKSVITLRGLPLASEELRSLAKELKRRCATGGSAKDGVIEIQGEHRDTLIDELETRGYKVKRS